MKDLITSSTTSMKKILFISSILSHLSSICLSITITKLSPSSSVSESDAGTATNHFPVVIWHGLSDSYKNPGIQRLAKSIDGRYPGKKVYLIRMGDSGEEDRRATWFGLANDEVQSACDQISKIEELSNGFDAIGFSQGGQLMRGYVERCNKPRVRNLITLGAQHMGVSGHAPCQSIFDLGCKIVERLIKSNSVYSSYAQNHVIPAQYFRDQSNIEPYLKHNEFLRDINNERLNDTQMSIESKENNNKNSRKPFNQADRDDEEIGYKPRNLTYKENFESLENFVMFEFSMEDIVIPPSSAFFTLSDKESNPIPLQELPIYKEDYIGLKKLYSEGKIHYGTCIGEHMTVDQTCWANVMNWLKDHNEDKNSGHRKSYDDQIKVSQNNHNSYQQVFN